MELRFGYLYGRGGDACKVGDVYFIISRNRSKFVVCVYRGRRKWSFTPATYAGVGATHGLSVVHTSCCCCFLGGSNKVWIGVGLVGATLWGRCTDDASEIGTAVAREIGLGWRQQG